MQSGRDDTLEEWYAIKFCFKLGKKCHRNVWKCFRLLFDYLAWIEHQFFEWHKRLKEGKESVRNDERCGRSKGKSIHQSWLAKGFRVRVTMFEVLREFRKRFHRKRLALFKLGQWHFHQSTTPSLSQTIWPRWASTHFLTLPIVETLLPVTFCLFPKLRGCYYETIEDMKEAVMKVIDTLTQEDFHGAFQKFVGTVQQVHCSRRRLLWRGLEFHHHHHVVLVARISLTLSRHFSLSFFRATSRFLT